MIPEHLVRRFISADQDAVVVSGRVPDLDSSQILPVVQKLDHALDDVRKEHPGYEIAVTGLSAIAARNSASMIEKLNRGLTIEFAAGRDLHRAGVPLGGGDVLLHPAGHLPGGFVGHGAVAARARGCNSQASLHSPCLSAGTERDDSFPQPAAGSKTTPGVSPELAVERATVLVGPALILTTVVLACGLVVTVFSDLPSLRLFGWLSAFAMIAALVADLFILRPTAMFLINLSQRLRGTANPVQPAEETGANR